MATSRCCTYLWRRDVATQETHEEYENLNITSAITSQKDKTTKLNPNYINIQLTIEKVKTNFTGCHPAMRSNFRLILCFGVFFRFQCISYI